ncbi:hypothetical protein BZG36_02837 [Bifiguratus adelaidae]|uniref:RCC1-like domain-containing protein n=1 Tax=Bifiguratus adelaidae TaxID=1938954 RepID=A0A261Y0J2_9FUNG|nr:hypothetical protein BZG36_02837 [Bifiguratus adelaidae]
MPDSFPSPKRTRTVSTDKMDVDGVQRSPRSHHRSPRISRSRSVLPVINTVPSLKAETGRVFVFGNGDLGQLGLGEDMLNRKKPMPVKEMDGKHIVDVVAGGVHTVVVNQTGKLYSWGCNDKRALGRSGEEYEPGAVEGLDHVKVVKVACGDSITVALTAEGKVWCWGTYRSSQGDLGFSKSQSIQDVPEEFAPLTGETIVDVACGTDHALALTDDGKVYGWGNGEQNQIGRRILERRKLNGLDPQLTSLRNITMIASGSYHSLAVDTEGRLWVWGLNNFGQCGLRGQKKTTLDIIPTPQRLVLDNLGENEDEDTRPFKIKQIAAGEQHSLLLMESGDVYAFGRADFGQLGISGEQVTSVVAQETLEHDGEENGVDELSSGFKKAIYHPVKVSIPAKVTAISCGIHHNLALTQEGQVYAWGFGESLALGNGSDEDEYVPVLLEGQKIEGGTCLGVAAGGQHSVVLYRV